MIRICDSKTRHAPPHPPHAQHTSTPRTSICLDKHFSSLTVWVGHVALQKDVSSEQDHHSIKSSHRSCSVEDLLYDVPLFCYLTSSLSLTQTQREREIDSERHCALHASFRNEASFPPTREGALYSGYVDGHLVFITQGHFPRKVNVFLQGKIDS